jgi:recombination protein RecA
MAKEKSVLDETMAMLNKKSANSVYRLDENHGIEIKRFSMGRLSLDIPIGGGAPEGRIIEFYGQESSGKTTATLHAIASYQAQGFKCAFIDYEHAFDPVYARKLGVDTNELIFSQPTTAEEGLDIIQELTSTGELKIIVVDSVAAMTPKKELEGESGDSVMGLHARLMSQALRKLAGKSHKTHTNIVFINQMREKIGVMFGDPRTTTGGNALKFYSSIRVEFRQGKKDEANGLNKGGLKVTKNKTYKPFETSEFDMEYGKGISQQSDIINYAEAADIIKKSGSWYSYGETKLGQGKNGVATTFADNPELEEEITNLVMAAYFPTKEQEEVLKEE